MAVRESVQIDLGKVDQLIEEQEAELEPKHRASIEYREIAERYVAGGVASSWQASPPHAIFIDRGDGSRIWDIDGNEYVDYHLGYGAMVVGHAHPAIVEAIQRQASRGTHFAQPTKHLDVVGENLAERFSLPLWRFCNSGTEATLEAARLMRAKTGRDLLIKIEGTYHGHHDSLMFSVIPDPNLMGPREHPVTVPQVPGIPQAFADLVRVVPFNDLDAARQAFEEHRDEVAGMMIAMLAAPDAWWGAPAAFVLFRIFDIAKPWPIREIDHGMGGGAGIMLDDVLAGLFAALGLLLIGYVT